MSKQIEQAARYFPFEFAAPFRRPLRLLGIRPETATVIVDPDIFAIRFGPWRLTTARANVIGATITGPFRWWRAVGPHLSLADRGVTFGSNAQTGVCVRFAAPVAGLFPTRWRVHPAATVTVADPDALVACLNADEA